MGAIYDRNGVKASQTGHGPHVMHTRLLGERPWKPLIGNCHSPITSNFASAKMENS